MNTRPTTAPDRVNGSVEGSEAVHAGSLHVDQRLLGVGQIAGAVVFLVLWVLGTADLLFTIWAQRFTPFLELNPLARP